MGGRSEGGSLGGRPGGDAVFTRGGKVSGELSGLSCLGLLQQENATLRLPVLALLSIGGSSESGMSTPLGR